MKRILGALLVGLLSACASQTIPPTIESGTESGSAGIANTSIDPNLNPILKDPNNILSKRSVYFDYDSFMVKNEYRTTVQAHAQYLRDNAAAKVLLQGNADERGSREYNLALGQKRADSVRSAMTLSGAKDSQIEAVSLGEEKPRATGHDEASWAENRRTDIRYQGE
ncbi:MAG: peptidoglycan-associated lipoprotein Pal [Nitrosospira sp.]|nr:peptidoglycan-associated lipoprotein Pal [Nitrosospira sp.]MBI0408410.1 peptidoglycan-associated lipoprotein Pal [Nitrosospira sp.]